MPQFRPPPSTPSSTSVLPQWRPGHSPQTTALTLTCPPPSLSQVMLNAPSALFRMGLYGGAIIMAFFILAGFW